MIPKIIHYCWFGGNELPPLARKCIKSWKKYCKDYKIIKWDESNFDISSAPLYVRQAYDAKKWAFVTDYVRLWAMTRYGGIYMDTDVEVVKKLNPFLKHKAFSGFESDTNIPTGIMACEKKFPMFEKFLKYYDDAIFIKSDGTMNTTTNVKLITDECLKHGLIQNNTLQNIEGFVLYPNEYFCPHNAQTGVFNYTNNTVTIHWFLGSWISDENQYESMKRINKRKEKMKTERKKKNKEKVLYLPKKILGEKMYTHIHNLFIRKK